MRLLIALSPIVAILMAMTFIGAIARSAEHKPLFALFTFARTGELPIVHYPTKTRPSF